MLPKEISKYAIQPIAALNHNMKMLKRLGYVTMCIFIVLLGNDGNIQAKADSPSYVTNVGSIAPQILCKVVIIFITPALEQLKK